MYARPTAARYTIDLPAELTSQRSVTPSCEF